MWSRVPGPIVSVFIMVVAAYFMFWYRKPTDDQRCRRFPLFVTLGTPATHGHTNALIDK
jgi:hypothetical protein